MHIRSFKAVASCALAIAFASATTVINAAQWTSFSIGDIGAKGYGISLARLPDGRFVLGDEGSLYVQNTWGTGTKTQIGGNNITFDPSFVAVKDGSSGILGAGGFGGPSGLYGFNPSATGTPLVSTAITTLQNFSAVYWKHPTSGREGWLLGGTNGTSGKHNLTFVSADGQKVGAITGVLSTYSSGVCADAAGNVYASLSEFGTADAADSEKVLKFTASQIDAAVNGVITATPALLVKSDATLVHQFDGAASIAVDSVGRLWAASYSGYMQVFDPVNGLTRNITPDHAPIVGAAGTIGYQLQTFNHGGVDYVGFLATDSFSAAGTHMIQGYKPVSELPSRAVAFAAASASKSENSGTATISLTISPAPTVKVTVPFSISGTAVKGKDFTIAQPSIVFNPGETSQTLAVNLIDIGLISATNKTVVIKLGAPAPATEAYVPTGSDTFTLSILEDDVKPVIAATQNFTVGRIGSAYSYQVVLAAGTATKYTASGLPPGMTINPVTGVISGRPTVAGEYDQIWITATNPAGTSTSAGYFLRVNDFNPVAHGGFVGFVNRTGSITSGLGARLDLNVTPTATFTGKITIGTVVNPLSGLLDTSSANPAGSATFISKLYTYVVNFTIDATTGALSGTVAQVTSTAGRKARISNPVVTTAHTSAAITGWRVQSDSTLVGLHNFVAATPGGAVAGTPFGATYGCVNVLATGTATVSLRAADGTAFVTSGLMGPNGEAVVYQTANSGTGSMLGSVAVASDDPQTVTGDLSWSRPLANGGWTPEIQLAASGGRYRPASGAGIVMSVGATAGSNASLQLKSDSSATAVVVPFNLAAPSQVSIAAPYKLSITNSTGAFTGSFKSGGVTVPFQGVIVPTTTSADPFAGAGYGYYLTPGASSVVTSSGQVLLLPSI